MKLKRKVCEVEGWHFKGSVDGPLPSFIVELLAIAQLKVKIKASMTYLTLETPRGVDTIYPGNWIISTGDDVFVKTNHQIHKDFDIIKDEKDSYANIEGLP